MRTIPASELIINDDGSIFHLHLHPGQLADTVILVGDPGRVALVAGFFDTKECEVSNREFKTVTGSYKGKRMTVLSTGIGIGNIDICVTELDALANVDFATRQEKAEKKRLTLVRLGTSGAIQPDIKVGEFVFSRTSCGFDGLLSYYKGRDAVCDLALEEAFVKHTGWYEKMPRPYFVDADKTLFEHFSDVTREGITIAAPGFYAPQGRWVRLEPHDARLNEKIESFGYEGRRITNFEMEGSALAGLAALMGHRAATICTIIARLQAVRAEDDRNGPRQTGNFRVRNHKQTKQKQRMKFSVSSSALLSLLATTGKVISNKNTLPILDYFLLELNGNTLQVTTSDLETTLVGQIEVDSVESEGTIAAPAKLMLDSLKEFPELPLTIEVNDKNWEIKINWKSGSLSIPGASAVSYPAVPQLNAEKKELRLDVDTLVNGINKTIFATADDELRPVMNGIYINLAPDALTFVGTDAHKLVKYEAETENEVTASFILPKKPANLLKSVLLKEDDAIEMAFDSKNALFKLKSHTLVCRLIEGNYPNYNAVIPSNNPNKVLVDRIELVNGIKRVAVCSNPTTNLIRMDIADNRITLTAQDIDFSVSANETISCSYDGQPISIGFKSTFLVEILSNMDTPTVVVELADSTRAGVFKPVYDDKQSSATLMLLMPMMINA